MAWFDPHKMPLMSAFFGLPKNDQQQVIDENREKGFDSAVGLALNSARHRAESASFYELPQAQYVTVLDVRARLGSITASFVEAAFGGDNKTLDGLPPSEQQVAREIAL